MDPQSCAAELLDDSTLLSRMLCHDSRAWREFQHRYDRLIWRCISKVTARFGGILSSEDIREVYANFWLSIMASDMRKLRLFNPERGNKLGTWVGMLAINNAWDFLRSVSRQPMGESIRMMDDQFVATENDPFDHVASRESCTRVEKLLESFSTRDRTFVTLYFVDGFSPEEVADQMGISVKTVYSKKHKIRTRLEKLMLEQGLAAAA